ncbi:carbohydrate ABC transporter permease [Streptomyces rimosus]|uniref:carbohydrate ABC transporter permease n=1 Tax=Streptomyces rimosus TaxID=1927 RepID=UPI003789986D
MTHDSPPGKRPSPDSSPREDASPDSPSRKAPPSVSPPRKDQSSDSLPPNNPPPGRRPATRRPLTRRTVGRAGQYLALLCYLVFLAFPFLWLVSTAFKPPRELGSLHPTWIPRAPTLDNFRTAFDEQPLLQAAANSLLAAAVSALVAIVLATPMAYVLARLRTRFARAATGWVVVSQAFPLVLVIIPLFLVLKTLHLVDARTGLILVYVVWSLPFALWMLTGYVRAVPPELEEAAAVDGAGRLRTLVSVTGPLLAPGIVATGLFAFITAWNEFFFALVLLKSPEKQTMPVVLTHFLGAEGVADLGPLAAAALLATLPSLLLFAVIQRRITGGMLAGAVKN